MYHFSRGLGDAAAFLPWLQVAMFLQHFFDFCGHFYFISFIFHIISHYVKVLSLSHLENLFEMCIKDLLGSSLLHQPSLGMCPISLIQPLSFRFRNTWIPPHILKFIAVAFKVHDAHQVFEVSIVQILFIEVLLVLPSLLIAFLLLL